MSVRIQGFAAPYNQANCYGELFVPGCWDTLLRAWAGNHPVDMFVMHDEKIGAIGHWDKVWTDQDGIWCEGNMADHNYDLALKNGLHELSVDFSAGLTSPLTERRLRMELTFTNDVPDFLAEIEAEEAAKRGYIETKQGRRCITKTENVTHITGLSEISFVNKGAFKGTYWQVIS